MRRFLPGFLLAFVWTASAGAQPAPPKKPADAAKPAEAAKPPAAKPAPKDDDLDDDDDSAPKKTEAAPEPEPETRQVSEEGPVLATPGPPRPAEQEPAPYSFVPAPLTRQRHVDFGADAGVWARTADSDTVSYAPGFAWGFHARADLLSYLGFRIYLNTTKHSVSIGTGEFGLPGTAVDQPNITVFQLGGRLEPTWVVLPTFRLFAGLGIAWGRATAPQLTTSGQSQINYGDRAGVFVETSGMLGATWDVVPSWLAVSVMLSGGVMTNQTGDMFQDEQVIDQTGTIRRIAGLPRFKNSASALVGIGMLL